MAALASAGAAGLSQTEVYSGVFGRHLPKVKLEALRDELVATERIDVRTEASNGDRPVLRWREKANAQTREELDEDAAVTDARPCGEGWVLWKNLVYIAEAGVPRGYALRQGRKEMERQHKANRVEKPGRVVLTDEQRGIRLIAREGLRLAVRAGFIERQGEWGRLIRDPTMMQRPWMEGVYTILGRAHPTLTGEFTPKPPKTLASIMEAHLGRKLLPEEYVRRRPGCAGSWDPADMKLCSRLLKPNDVEGHRHSLDEYHARVAQAPRINEPRPFEVNLPKDRRQT